MSISANLIKHFLTGHFQGFHLSNAAGTEARYTTRDAKKERYLLHQSESALSKFKSPKWDYFAYIMLANTLETALLLL